MTRAGGALLNYTAPSHRFHLSYIIFVTLLTHFSDEVVLPCLHKSSSLSNTEALELSTSLADLTERSELRRLLSLRRTRKRHAVGVATIEKKQSGTLFNQDQAVVMKFSESRSKVPNPAHLRMKW